MKDIVYDIITSLIKSEPINPRESPIVETGKLYGGGKDYDVLRSLNIT